MRHCDISMLFGIILLRIVLLKSRRILLERRHFLVRGSNAKTNLIKLPPDLKAVVKEVSYFYPNAVPVKFLPKRCTEQFSLKRTKIRSLGKNNHHYRQIKGKDQKRRFESRLTIAFDCSLNTEILIFRTLTGTLQLFRH